VVQLQEWSLRVIMSALKAGGHDEEERKKNK
jgi:hypothetical protein